MGTLSIADYKVTGEPLKYTFNALKPPIHALHAHGCGNQIFVQYVGAYMGPFTEKKSRFISQ